MQRSEFHCGSHLHDQVSITAHFSGMRIDDLNAPIAAVLHLYGVWEIIVSSGLYRLINPCGK